MITYQLIDPLSKELIGNILTELPNVGEWVQKINDHDDSERKPHVFMEQYREPLPVPAANLQVQLTNVNCTNAVKQGDIWWVKKGQALVVTGDLPLPNKTLMLMAEKMVDATKAVDDTRFLANIDSGGKLTLNAVFDDTGNYLISAERLNRGLERINQPIRLSFPDIEFDVYV